MRDEAVRVHLSAVTEEQSIEEVPCLDAAGVVADRQIDPADEDGVVVIPRDKAGEVLKKAQEFDFTEHSMYPFIERFKSLTEAIAKFGRL